MILIGVDSGGTFTDFIYKDDTGWGVYKCLSTPSNPAEAVLAGIRHIAGEKPVEIVHGSTVATNALLEKKGASTVLITNKGFEDILEIGRQNRLDLYALDYLKKTCLVPEKRRFGVKCRMDKRGKILDDLDEKELAALREILKKTDFESIAVSLLFSFENKSHEVRIGEVLSELNLPISLSHKILAEFREYERTATTVINAYVMPKMKHYIDEIGKNKSTQRLRIMQSNGGSISSTTAANEPVRTILSGPAGGVVGAYEIGKTAGHTRLITFDMGGTSTDVALINDHLPLTMESFVAGFPVKTPMLDINTVGAGGGSIACLDSGGALKVGPESAGADPGPICYGFGEMITVTDANLFLGRMVPEHFLGGDMRILPERLKGYFDTMAAEAGITPIELAEGILTVANTAMENAIRVISVEKGFDPAEFSLVSFGGAGGMHAVFLARMLNIPKIIIPANPGILSARGMLTADIIKDYSQTVMLRSEIGKHDNMASVFEEFENCSIQDLEKEGVPRQSVILEKYLDMRYRGQSYELMVPFSETYMEAFHDQHKQNYGYSNRDKEIEIVNVRLRAIGRQEEKRPVSQTLFSGNFSNDAVIMKKDVIFEGVNVSTMVLLRERLRSGNIIKGPAIIVEYSSTIVIPPSTDFTVDGFDNLVISIL
ncbi:MAG: hydantoinase/oxoprolinase family protein [Desulfobacterales bacterium]|nr:hydantoinase/oxoprolinase family protein [Desulfobacterales bacterium]